MMSPGTSNRELAVSQPPIQIFAEVEHAPAFDPFRAGSTTFVHGKRLHRQSEVEGRIFAVHTAVRKNPHSDTFDTGFHRTALRARIEPEYSRKKCIAIEYMNT